MKTLSTLSWGTLADLGAWHVTAIGPAIVLSAFVLGAVSEEAQQRLTLIDPPFGLATMVWLGQLAYGLSLLVLLDMKMRPLPAPFREMTQILYLFLLRWGLYITIGCTIPVLLWRVGPWEYWIFVVSLLTGVALTHLKR